MRAWRGGGVGGGVARTAAALGMRRTQQRAPLLLVRRLRPRRSGQRRRRGTRRRANRRGSRRARRRAHCAGARRAAHHRRRLRRCGTRGRTRTRRRSRGRRRRARRLDGRLPRWAGCSSTTGFGPCDGVFDAIEAAVADLLLRKCEVRTHSSALCPMRWADGSGAHSATTKRIRVALRWPLWPTPHPSVSAAQARVRTSSCGCAGVEPTHRCHGVTLPYTGVAWCQAGQRHGTA